jgi:hypothetical protein
LECSFCAKAGAWRWPQSWAIVPDFQGVSVGSLALLDEHRTNLVRQLICTFVVRQL